MNKYLAAYIGTAVAIVLLDMLWLGVIAKTLYQQGIGHLMAEKTNVVAGVLFYALFSVGVVIFAVAPQGSTTGWGRTVVLGALFGFFAYCTYDLSNLATLRDWPVNLTLIDIAWGTALTAAAAAAGKAAMDWASGA